MRSTLFCFACLLFGWATLWYTGQPGSNLNTDYLQTPNAVKPPAS